MRRATSASAPMVVGLFFIFFGSAFRLSWPIVPATTQEDLFDTSVLHELRLSIHSRELRLLRQNYGENTYYPADLVWRNNRVRNVAVRSRGGDSRSPVKLGLLLDFDRYTPRQTFLGLRSLVLDNLRQDPSMMREPLAMAVFRRMGQPAPRESWCRLYINNDYQGVYSIVEDVDPLFLAEAFGRDDGYLFEYQWSGPYVGDYLGADLNAYRAILAARTHENEPIDTLYEPIRFLFEAMNAGEAVAGRQVLEQALDLEQFVTVLGIEVALGEEDGIVGVHGMNNFYLHRDRDSTRHSMIVWDRDRALTFLRSSIFTRTDENILVRRALAYNDLFELYLRVLEETAHSVSDTGWLSAEIERLWTLLGPSVYLDTRKPWSNAEFEAGVDYLRDFALVRPGWVLFEVALTRSTRRP